MIAEAGADAITRRRADLVSRIEAQRGALAGHVAGWAPALHTIDKAVAAVRFVRAHPGILVVAGVVLIVFGRGRAWRWARRGVAAWQALRSVRRLLFGPSV